eukprot:scaffold8870_cov39-Prasinocladus_malaysianus.AAC.1
MAQFTEAVVNIKFDEEPKYAAYRDLFEPLCGQAGPSRPILTETAARVGAKRNRDAIEGEEEDNAPKKKARIEAQSIISLSRNASCHASPEALTHVFLGAAGTASYAVDNSIQCASANEAALPLQRCQHPSGAAR